MRKVVLRAARAADMSAVMGFLKKNRHDDVLDRREAIAEAVTRNLYFILETDGVVVGAAGVFGLDSNHLELGGARIVPPAQGYGLQSLLQMARVASSTVNEVQMGLIVAVKPANAFSLATTKGSGFIEWGTPSEAAYLPCKECPAKGKADTAGQRCCCNYYTLPQTARATLVRKLLDTKTSLTKLGRGSASGVNITVEIELALLVGERRADLEEYCIDVLGPAT